MLNRTRSLLLLVIAIGAIVIIHEFGHFITAQLFGIQTPVFSIGFGPKLFGVTIKGTTFQIAALPLGGFVSMNMQQLDQKPYWQKMIIILAGIFNNMLLAFIALIWLFALNRQPSIPIIKRILKKSPAQRAGLHSSDVIVAVNGNNISDIDDLMKTIHHNPNKTMQFTINRSGTLHELHVHLDSRILIGSTIGYLGAEFEKDPQHAASISHVIKNGFASTIKLITLNVSYFMQLMRNRPSQVGDDLNMLATKNIQTGFTFFLFFIAYTSIQIGLFNLLPIPMLDGGQAFQYSLQFALGKFLSAEQIIMVHYLLIIVVVIYLLSRPRNRSIKQ